MKTQPEISNEDIIKCYIGMLCLGDVHFEDMEKFSNDMVFKNGLCVKNVPSSSTLRIRLNGFEEEIENILRMDSGFDSGDNLAVWEEFEVMYLVKRNPRKETAEKWLEIAEEDYSEYYDIQSGKKVYIGSIDKEIADSSEGEKSKTRRIVFEVTRKSIESDGQLLLAPEIEFNTYWAPSCFTEEEIIELYHKHQNSLLQCN